MFSTLISAAALSLLAVRGTLADFTVKSTAFTQCAPTHISWSGTDKPVNILLVPANSPCDDTLYDLGDHSQGSMTWNVTLPAGTELLISLEDSNGEEAWSDTITVGSSKDESCLTAAQRAEIKSTSSSGSGNSSSTDSASSSTPTGSGSTPNSGSSSSGQPPIENVSGGDATPLGASNGGLNPSVSGASRAFTPLVLVGSIALAASMAIL